ncbi:MAG: hypothetical protein ABIQ38_08615 [Ilumatobacteraceae bacterium]
MTDNNRLEHSMNQETNRDKDREHETGDASSMDSFFDLDQDGKVSISETLKADAELAETYAENAEKKGGFKGMLGRIFSKFFKAVDKK